MNDEIRSRDDRISHRSAQRHYTAEKANPPQLTAPMFFYFRKTVVYGMILPDRKRIRS